MEFRSDFYPTNNTTLRRLQTKCQSPCTQVFKMQSSNLANQPQSEMNLNMNDYSMNHEHRPVFSIPQTSPFQNSQNDFSSCAPQTNSTLPLNQPNPSDSTTMQADEEDDDDAAPLEVIKKKVKTTIYTTADDCQVNRKISCEEEKEESDRSTTYETRSDFNTPNEASDFIISPPMRYQHSKDPSEMRLDSEDECFRQADSSPFLSSNEAFNDKSLEEMAQQVIDTHGSDFIYNSEPKFKCHLSHQIGLNSSGSNRKGCPRCEALLEECREFAKNNGGKCLNDEYELTIRYQCKKGHCWTLNHKNARRRWCAQCAKEQRQFLKKKCEEEKIEREKQEEEAQKKLFEEAKKKASANTAPSHSFGGMKAGSCSQKGMTTLEYFQRMDYEIETLAKKYTVQYMSQKDFKGDVSHQQILQVYKIMIMPEEVLQCYMFNFNIDTLKSEFKRMALIIHPDKNKHPQAGNAFHKIYKVYEVALSRLEGSQQKP